VWGALGVVLTFYRGWGGNGWINGLNTIDGRGGIKRGFDGGGELRHQGDILVSSMAAGTPGNSE
jgi:hypothetical protein